MKESLRVSRRNTFFLNTVLNHEVNTKKLLGVAFFMCHHSHDVGVPYNKRMVIVFC